MNLNDKFWHIHCNRFVFSSASLTGIAKPRVY